MSNRTREKRTARSGNRAERTGQSVVFLVVICLSLFFAEIELEADVRLLELGDLLRRVEETSWHLCENQSTREKQGDQL